MYYTNIISKTFAKIRICLSKLYGKVFGHFSISFEKIMFYTEISTS